MSNQWNAGPDELSGDEPMDTPNAARPKYLLCVAVGGPIHGETRAVHEGSEYVVKVGKMRYRYSICPDPENARGGRLVLVDEETTTPTGA